MDNVVNAARVSWLESLVEHEKQVMERFRVELQSYPRGSREREVREQWILECLGAIKKYEEAVQDAKEEDGSWRTEARKAAVGGRGAEPVQG